MVKIFVGNVASSTTEDELRVLFEQHGTVSDCDILKSYGFVHMDNEDEAQNAVSALHKVMLNGSRITVEFATTKVRNATKIYVGKLPEGVTVSKIRELFQPHGKVVECDIVKNYAFVHMQRENDALEAIRQLQNVKLDGQKIVVSLSCNNQSRDSREDYYTPPAPHYPPPFPPPHPMAGDFYAPRGRFPPPPLPPPPPRPYYERDAYERSIRPQPYAAATSANYYERDPYERRPLLSHAPHVSSRYYRDRSPLDAHRTLLPPPPPPPPPPASYMRSYAHGPVHATPPPPPPPPPSASAAAAYRRYPPVPGYSKDSYEEKYNNGYSASY